MHNVAAPVVAADGSPLTITEEGPFAAAPMPESDEALLSSWPPPHYIVLAGARPKRIKANIKKVSAFAVLIGMEDLAPGVCINVNTLCSPCRCRCWFVHGPGCMGLAAATWGLLRKYLRNKRVRSYPWSNNHFNLISA